MNKIDLLKSILSLKSSAVIAFSGGVDSSFLAKIASGVYKEKLLLLTVKSAFFSAYELEESIKIARLLKLKHQVIDFDVLHIPVLKNNTPDRCYYCKNEIFKIIKAIASNEGYEAIFDGSNIDDNNDYRPGRKALKELGIVSPLAEAGFSKEEIRYYSKQYNLPTSDKPAIACLATRFPYGEELTKNKLLRVGETEQKIRDLGFIHFRVRSHQNLARIEFSVKEIEEGWKRKSDIEKICKETGFQYVAIDTTGYRTGAMNEELKNKRLS